MTTIKSLYGKDLEIDTPASGAFADGQIILRCERGSAHNPAGHHEGRTYLRADLLAALDATANADVEALREDLHVARDQMLAFRDGMTAAEAEALEQAKLVHTWADRAEKAENDAREWKARAEEWAESKESWKADAAEWWARAEKAEATVAQGDELANDLASELKAVAAKGDHWQERAEKAEAKVEAVAKIAKDMRTWGWQWKVQDWGEKLDAALADKPAFTLPTEPGVRFEATHRATGTRNEFVTFTDRVSAVYVLHEGTYWVADEVLRDFEDFHLIGADQ